MLPLRPRPDDRPPATRGAVLRAGRIDLVDAARGLAVLGMIAFHFDWDLAHFGYVSTPPMASTAWSLFGNAVAAAFLALSGAGLVLARGRGWRHALGRLAQVAGWAAAVTIVTAWLFPQETVGFGILHCIAATNLIALMLLRARVSTILAAAAAALIAPLVLTTGATEGPPWWWLGISNSVPRTLDYRPVLPWLGVTMAGVAAARLLPLGSLPTLSGPWRGLMTAGRHSLLIYLVHQPILFGLLWLVSPVPRADDIGSFVPACQQECLAAGAGQEGCRAACACAAAKFAATNDAKLRASDIAAACLDRQP